MDAIVPAVLPRTYKDLEDALDRFAGIRGVRGVQIDVVDGRFASPATWPYADGPNALVAFANAGKLLPHAGQLRYEVDLMVQSPEETLGAWIALGVSRVTIHAESTTSLSRIFTNKRTTYGHDKGFIPDLLSFGLALGLESDLSLIEPYLTCVEYVQFMGIARIGRQGEPFDERVLSRIKQFHKRYPDMPIQVDGAVTTKTAPALLSAGVRRLIVGHDLMNAHDMQAKFNELSALVHTHGIYE